MIGFRDARDFQILFLSIFLVLGVWVRDFSVKPDAVAVILITSFAVQWVINKDSMKSAAITGISLCLLLRANSLWPLALASAIAIASKAVFRFRGKHFFNPSNLGIIAALALTGNSWVTPGQWGADLWLFLLFLCTGGLIVRKVGRWDTTIAFLAVYAGLEAARNAWLGWTPDVFVHKMMSGSLLLFSFFMITDPRAIPDRRIARILWAAAVAVLSTILRNKFFMPTAIFWALFALSPLTIVLDSFWPAKRFQWKPKTPALTREVALT